MKSWSRLAFLCTLLLFIFTCTASAKAANWVFVSRGHFPGTPNSNFSLYVDVNNVLGSSDDMDFGVWYKYDKVQPDNVQWLVEQIWYQEDKKGPFYVVWESKWYDSNNNLIDYSDEPSYPYDLQPGDLIYDCALLAKKHLSPR